MVDRYKLKPEGIIDDVMLSLVSWEYPTDFMVIQPKLMEGHPMILGRPWLATTDAYISCRKGEMTISNGLSTNKTALHPPSQLASTNALWVELTDHNIWTIYFHGSRHKEGEGSICLLINPHGNITMLACFLEFDCTNNVAEHEKMVRGLKKELDLQIKCIEVFGDSEVVIRQVRDSIHCTSHHLITNERYGI